MVDGSAQLCFGLLLLSNPLGAWKEPSPRIWRVCYNEEDCVVEVLLDQDGVMLYELG